MAVRPGEGTDIVALSSGEWETKVRELAQAFGVGAIDQSSYAPVALLPAGKLTLPVGVIPESPLQLLIAELSSLQEDNDRFYVLAVVEKGAGHLKVASVAWKKEGFAERWHRAREPMQGEVAGQAYGYRLPEIKSACGSCADDTWTLTPAPPDPRAGYTAVWTGSEIIVWGGAGTDGSLNIDVVHTPGSPNVLSSRPPVEAKMGLNVIREATPVARHVYIRDEVSFRIWRASLTREPANPATASSAIGSLIAGSGNSFTPVVTLAAEPRLCLCGTRECPSYQTDPPNKKYALPWNCTFRPVNAGPL